MWSGADTARGVAGDRRPMRRGQVWLAELPPEGRRRLVVLLSGDDDVAIDPVVLAAPVAPSTETGRGRIAVDGADGIDSGMAIDVRRLISLEPHNLVIALGALSDDRLAEVDIALGDVLGLGRPQPASRLDAAEAPATTNGTRQNGRALVPPPPPPEPERTMPPPVVSSMLDDHPIAQIFGHANTGLHAATPPPSPAAGARAQRERAADSPAHPASPTRAAAVMPELLEIVRRRLQRNAPRLEAVLGQAADEGRSVEWAAAAVRHSAVRGVTQSTLDEIAREFSAAGARRNPSH